MDEDTLNENNNLINLEQEVKNNKVRKSTHKYSSKIIELSSSDDELNSKNKENSVKNKSNVLRLKSSRKLAPSKLELIKEVLSTSNKELSSESEQEKYKKDLGMSVSNDSDNEPENKLRKVMNYSTRLRLEFSKNSRINNNRSKKIEPDEFPELNTEQEELINNSLIKYPKNEVIAYQFNIQITREDIRTLKDKNKLNDNIIDFYMHLIAQQRTCIKIHTFSTFFYQSLLKNNCEIMKSWTKKLDIFSFDLIFLPINWDNIHWTLAVINLKRKEIIHYDSLNKDDENYNECVEKLKFGFKITENHC
jgi:Ulp1 family protease